MRKSHPLLLAYAILFLFLVQLAGALIESIYILDLMNTSLDEKALGVLFFLSPILLIPFQRKYPRRLAWFALAILFFSRGLLPYLDTADRLLASGFGFGATLSLFFLLLGAKPKGEPNSRAGLWASAGLALAVSLSVLLRTMGSGLDYSLISSGGWVGWGLGLSLGLLIAQLDWVGEPAQEKKNGGVTSAILGLHLVLTLILFAFSAPSVIARWTEGNYTWIVVSVSLLTTGWVWFSLINPHWLDRLVPRLLLLWNLLFTLSLTATILVHRVPFPPTPESAPVVVGSPGFLQAIPLALMLLLFPVIFLDFRLFLDQLIQATPPPRALVPGILLGGLALILLVFAHIFTNVWGYIQPVSLWFRGKFYLPYLLLAGGITLLLLRAKRPGTEPELAPSDRLHWVWPVLLTVVFLGSLVSALPVEPPVISDLGKSSLLVMTYNTQQSNNDFGERSFEEQLALIRRVSPDLLVLQESDSTRISLNNNDYVRYFADNLGYYSYYGPATVSGTYGTAILSRYPLLNPRTVFSYSDKDEIGIAEVEIEVNGRVITIYNVHPDGSDVAMLAFARTLLERASAKPYIIALGDYNLRDYEEAYQMIAAIFTNAWVSVYPSEISPDGLDMSGDNRIDHIFISPSMGVRNPVYILPPASNTDHPVHWAEIYWDIP